MYFLEETANGKSAEFLRLFGTAIIQIFSMPEKYIIPLQEIDKAIRINCQIDHTAFKSLTLVKEGNNKNQGVGRSLFIYVARKVGYDKELICDYLAITGVEYDNKVDNLPQLYRAGKYFFNNKVKAEDLDDTCLLFYRKLLLVGNYLRYKYSFEL